MPIYFNRTRGPLPLELRSGSRVVPPKGSIDIAPEDEGSASVVRYVKKGLLIAPRVRPPKEAPPKKVEAIKVEEKPKVEKAPPKAAPKPAAPAPKPESKPAASEIKPKVVEPPPAPPPEEKKDSADLLVEEAEKDQETKKSKSTRSRR